MLLIAFDGTMASVRTLIVVVQYCAALLFTVALLVWRICYTL
jgi:hypothetical protein